MPRNTVTVTTNVDCPLLHADRETRRVLEVTLNAYCADRTATRVPINCALVIDRSGSMAEERKLSFAQEAARYIIDHLGDRDSVAVVAFDNKVDVIAPSRSLTPAARRELHTAIERLYPRNATDLHSGWLRGTEQVVQSLTATGVNRVLLLSDGLANHGITDAARIAEQVRAVRDASIATSTFGVGADYDETLLRTMAENGGGHYYYIESAYQIPQFFQRELGEMTTVVARRAHLTVAAPAGIQVKLRGDLPHEQSGEGVSHYLGDLFDSEERKFYLRIVTPVGAAGDPLAIGIEVTYDGPEGHERVSGEAVYTRCHPFRDVPRNRSVLRGYAQTCMAAANRALALQRAGRGDDAATMLLSDLNYYRQDLDDEALRAYDELTKKMKTGMTSVERKAADYNQYRMRHAGRK